MWVARVASLLVVLAVAVGLEAGGAPVAVSPVLREEQRRLPSIVLVLADDLSMDLVKTMRTVRRMQRQGAFYRHAYVVDSFCCPSRTSLLTGQYPHQTGVLTNNARPVGVPDVFHPVGGWAAFRSHGNVARSVNVQLQEAGYATGYVGKYLNEYEFFVRLPSGWSTWRAVLGGAYDGWDFGITRSRGGELVVRNVGAPRMGASAARKDAVYAGEVIADHAVSFIREHREATVPYFLVVAPYATHGRLTKTGHYPGDPVFPPAFRDRARPGRPGNCGPVRCSRIGVDDLRGYRDDQSDNVPRSANGRRAPQWRSGTRTSDGAAVAFLRTRAQMAQSIDRLLRRISRTIGPQTYVVFTSDNGLHIGQHGLPVGKGTPFVSDARVPLVVTGPGIQRGVRAQVVSNIDLAPTFEELAGLEPAAYRAGRSLVPTFRDRTVSRRRYAFFEHAWSPPTVTDPDARLGRRTRPEVPSYLAVRNRSSLLVRFDLDPRWRRTRHAWEFYDYSRVGWERTNEYGKRRHRREIKVLKRKLRVFERCAAHTGNDPVPPRCRRSLR
jgi:arylsulfatase A-like enzyme